MSKSKLRIDNALAKMNANASKLSVVFLVLLIADCVFILAMLALQIYRFSTEGTDGFGPFEVMPLVSSIMDFVIYGAVLAVARNIAKDVAIGRSPFTLRNAKQLRLIAWLLILSFVLSFFGSPSFSSVSHVGIVELGVDPDSLDAYPTLFFDIKSLVGAIVGFLLSGAWRYGALLQADSDDFL